MHHAREHRTVRPAQARGQRDHRPRGVSTSIGSRIRRRSSTSRSRPIASRLDTSTIGCSAWRWRPRAARSSTARPERRERLRVAGLPRSDRRGARGGDQRRPRVTRGRRSGVRRRHSRGRKRATRAREAGRLDHGGRLAGGGGRVPTLADACTSAQGNRSFAPAEAPTRARRSAPARIRIGVVILRAGRSGDVSLARGAHKSELYNIFYKYPPTGGFTRIRTYFEYYMCQRFLSDDGWIAPDVPLPAFVCPQAMVRAHRSFSRIPEFLRTPQRRHHRRARTPRSPAPARASSPARRAAVRIRRRQDRRRWRCSPPVRCIAPPSRSLHSRGARGGNDSPRCRPARATTVSTRSTPSTPTAPSAAHPHDWRRCASGELLAAQCLRTGRFELPNAAS